MASRVISRIISRSALSAPHRPLLVAAFLGNNNLSPSAPLVRNFLTGTASSSSTPQQEWCYTGVKPSKSDFKVGLDFQHWRVLVEEPVGNPTRDQIIDSYIGILATVVGSKADARLKIYSVSTKYYYEFGVLVPEDVAVNLIGVPHVLRVIPDIYYSVDASSYGGKMSSHVISRIISRSALSAPHRPLLVAAFLGNNRLSPSAPSTLLVRNFSTGTASSLSTPQEDWRYTGVKPSKSQLEVGLDFQHWRVLVEEPVGNPTRDQIIDSYIDILATVVGSKADARLKIYSVSTKYYFEFGVLVPEDVAAKLIGVPYVLRVIPDMYLTFSGGRYGGESL